jgi:signal transduction histidine kinase
VQLGQSSLREKRQPVGGAGSGLGLWVASTLVSANGGTSHADSRGPNLGTTISLRFPTASEDTPKPADAIDE